MTMLILFVILLFSCFFYVPEGSTSEDIIIISSDDELEVPPLENRRTPVKINSFKQGNQKDDNEMCVDCNSVAGTFDLTSKERTYICNHKVCLGCYNKNNKQCTIKCPGCKINLEQDEYH
ncbi:uncharacterized protein LOC126897474 [Daktulosphaira vitifoliae]|uniref:uncharacterized protein LOC126897474 n=1 Tax=Daktulosphaira vitifoliae TaxID=58002 RepID=UPI0021AA3938|nr:uncharacterized protein LOC126897474 [Daktulosphaira vitifoliae]